MKTSRVIGRKIGTFRLRGRDYFVAYTHIGVNAFIYADDLGHGPAVAKVEQPRSPRRRIVIDETLSEKPSRWHREFRQHVTRLCREDVYRAADPALSEAGEPR